jgi:hypothetical protein
MFGKVQPGLVRLDMNGNIAVKTSNGYKAYSTKSGRLINCDNFVFNIGEEFFFIIPTNKVVKGDIILASGKNGKRTPKCVIDVNPTYITVINYEDSVVEQILPERHFFMGSAFFYGKIVSMMNFGKTDGKINMKNMMKFKMMSEMMSGNKTNPTGGNDLMGTMLMMSMFNGKDNDFTDMFNFDEMFDFEEDADKPVEVEVVEVEPKGDN